MNRIDKLDRKILNIVTKNARIPSKDIALECGVSRAAIHQRLQRLQELGVITGSGYWINPIALGYNVCAIVAVRLDMGSQFEDAVRELEKIPEVTACNYTTGSYSMILKVFARDCKHLRKLLNERIQTVKGVTQTETFLVLEKGLDRQIEITTDE